MYIPPIKKVSQKESFKTPLQDFYIISLSCKQSIYFNCPLSLGLLILDKLLNYILYFNILYYDCQISDLHNLRCTFFIILTLKQF